jgi:hypothetical protein
MIGGILAPFLEVGFGAVRQIFLPRNFERSSGIIECLGGAVSLLPWIAAASNRREPRHNEFASVPVVH